MSHRSRRKQAQSIPRKIAPEIIIHNHKRKRSLWALALIVVALIITLSLLNRGGVAGDFLSRVLRVGLGLGALVLPLILIIQSIALLRHAERTTGIRTMWIVGILMSLTGLGLFETIDDLLVAWKNIHFGGGGIIGQIISTPLVTLFDPTLTIIILAALCIGSSMFVIPWTLGLPAWSPRNFIITITERIRASREETALNTEKADKKKVRVQTDTEETTITLDEDVEEITKESSQREKKEIVKESARITETVIATAPALILPSTYVKPPISLLSTNKGNPGVGNTKAVAELVQRTLANFNIEVVMDEITIGPSITRYAMKPALGTKLSRIMGLENEISLAVAAYPIRIEAPIPGKSLVGIEIPNQVKTMVGLGSLLAEQEYKETKKPLLVALGKAISGKAVFGDIAKMPHMLIAGATGSGKSVTVHNVIVSLLCEHGPEDVRFIFVDPKRVELTLYDGIPHLLTPVIKDPKRAILALKWATSEMDRRYNILEEYKVRDIGSYHSTIVGPAYKEAEKKPELTETLPERMPYIVVIIDELADLMQLYPRELESCIVRLAQMSRAVGIHLILSTQRPSVNVITGLIKANIPTRLALKVASQIDSRTILDSAGAETLLGRGDMLYRDGSMPEAERIQCANLPEEEVKAIVAAIIKNNREIILDQIELPDTLDEEKSLASGTFGDDEDADDPLFEEVRLMVIKSQKASTSYIQRKFSIGYSRAARLMDILEERGVIGAGQGAKPRDVLIQSVSDEKQEFGEVVDNESE